MAICAHRSDTEKVIGRNSVKRMIKRISGQAAVLQHRWSTQREIPQACIFAYHRVADIPFVDRTLDDWSVSLQRFEEQVKTASEFGEIIPLSELFQKLRSKNLASRPWVCITFDDGFANFFYHAVPILKRYRAHATLFVPTSQIDQKGPMPFDRWGKKYFQNVPDLVWRPIQWNELEKSIDSGVVSIGSHSHDHLNALESSMEQLANEAGRSREILTRRLGAQAGRAYAYPYGSSRLGQVNTDYIGAVKLSGYECAFSTDLGLATADSNAFLVPRIEAHALDTPAVIRAKISGTLDPYFFADRMRKGRRDT